MNDTARLSEALAAVCPIHGVWVGAGAYRIDFKDEATAQQRSDAEGIASTWDFSAAAAAARENLHARVLARKLVELLQTDLGKALRAELAVIVDEVNLLRARLRAQDEAVAGAGSLGALKSAWNTLAAAQPLPERTLAQAKTAILGKIDSGTVD